MAERARILVTDDRPEILRLVERTLGEHYDCELAGDVPEARRRLAAHEYELALCDIEMPGESGLTLIDEIVHSQPDTAVVMVTGVDDPSVVERAFELGAHGYLVKPFRPGQLLITTMTALRRRELEIAQRAHTRAVEDRLAAMMDHAPLAVFVKDRRRRYVIANRVANEIAGLGDGGLIGRRDEDFLPGEVAEESAEIDRIVLGGEVVEREQAFRFRGEEIAFSSVRFPYFDDSGEIVGTIGVAADITDRRRAEELQSELSRAQEQAIAELRSSRRETVERLSRAIEMRDAETGAHVNRMATVASLLAIEVGLSPERAILLREAAPMHDVGKIATPDAILSKPGPLTEAERAEMQSHTTIGYRILSGSESDLLQVAARIALTHHERFDGSGYPRGLRGEEIPIEGRIVAVADVFDALLSDRCYRDGMDLDQAIELIRSERETHFDPVIVDALMANLDEALLLRG